MASEAVNLTFKQNDFVHLHLHTDYSLLQSAIQLKPLARKLAEHDMQACAITDYGNMYGAVSFYNTMKYSGFRPIIGYEAFVAHGSRFDQSLNIPAGERPYYHLVLLAENFTGYMNLVHLASKAFTEGFHHKPRIDLELLAERSDGLIALSSGMSGSICHFLKDGKEDRAFSEAGKLEDIFGKGRFYLEVQDHGTDDTETVAKIVALSKKCDVPLVAANDCHYLEKEDSLAHGVLACIADGRTLDRSNPRALATDEYYVKSADEMWDVFGAELPESSQYMPHRRDVRRRDTDGRRQSAIARLSDTG
jgi:DNA polymerase III, alpha subunit